MKSGPDLRYLDFSLLRNEKELTSQPHLMSHACYKMSRIIWVRGHPESVYALIGGGAHPKVYESVLEGGGSEGCSVRTLFEKFN